MAKQITLKEALELVEFKFVMGKWRVKQVKTNVLGDVWEYIYGDVRGHVYGTINGGEWKPVETLTEKLQLLIEEGADKEQLLEAINQLEESDG